MLFRTPALRRCSAFGLAQGYRQPLFLCSLLPSCFFLSLPFFRLFLFIWALIRLASRLWHPGRGRSCHPCRFTQAITASLTLGSATCRPASVAAQPPPAPAGCRADRSRPAVRPGHRAGCRQLQPVLDQGVLTRILANLEQLRHAVFPVARGKNKAGARAPQFSVCLAVLRRCGFNIAQDVALRVCNDRSFYMNECNSEGQPKREKELGQVSRIRLNL